jgi:hypothetical protein
VQALIQNLVDGPIMRHDIRALEPIAGALLAYAKPAASVPLLVAQGHVGQDVEGYITDADGSLSAQTLNNRNATSLYHACLFYADKEDRESGSAPVHRFPAAAMPTVAAWVNFLTDGAAQCLNPQQKTCACCFLCSHKWLQRQRVQRDSIWSTCSSISISTTSR